MKMEMLAPGRVFNEVGKRDPNVQHKGSWAWRCTKKKIPGHLKEDTARLCMHSYLHSTMPQIGVQLSHARFQLQLAASLSAVADAKRTWSLPLDTMNTAIYKSALIGNALQFRSEQ